MNPPLELVEPADNDILFDEQLQQSLADSANIKKEVNLPVITIPPARAIADIVLGLGIFVDIAPPFESKYHFKVVESGPRLIFKEGAGQVLKPASTDDIRADILRYCYQHSDALNMEPKPSIANAATKLIEAIAPDFNGEIVPVRFKSDTGYTYHRLDFDPIPCDNLDDAPYWKELITRMGSNGAAFCMRVGSLFDPCANRKQAVYIYEEIGDSGKSQIAAILQRMFGPSFMTLSNEDMVGRFWRITLLGKRVFVINEATVKFINSEAFKCLTGDSVHSIQQKGKPITRANLDCIVFFFSNNAPVLPNKKPILNRIIDIHLQPFEGEKIPESQYQKLLESELSYFIGYCLRLYEPYRGGRSIPCDKKELLELAEGTDGDAISFFDEHFITDKEAKISPTTLREFLLAKGIAMQTYGKWKEVWRREYGIIYKRAGMVDGKRGSFFYHGLKLRNPIVKKSK